MLRRTREDGGTPAVHAGASCRSRLPQTRRRTRLATTCLATSPATHQAVAEEVERSADTVCGSYRLAQSNFRDDADADPSELFDLSESTLAPTRQTLEAIAAEVLLKEGVPLDAAVDAIDAGGAPVIVADGVAVVLSL